MQGALLWMMCNRTNMPELLYLMPYLKPLTTLAYLTVILAVTLLDSKTTGIVKLHSK